MEFLVLVAAFIFGATIGSFLNVCIHRLPDASSIVTPGSYCPGCKAPISWYDNIPLLSFLLLRGKCRRCGCKISLRYPVVELITAVLFTCMARRFLIQGGWAIAIFTIYSILCCALIISTFIDFRYRIIPDEVSLTGIVVAPIMSAVYPALHSSILLTGIGPIDRLLGIIQLGPVWLDGFLASVLGILVGGGSIYAAGVIGKLVFRKDAMGGGDVKLMGMIGGVLGWKAALVIFFIAPFFGAVIGIILYVKTKSSLIPYGPYLSLATILVMLWNEPLYNAWLWYVRLIYH